MLKTWWAMNTRHCKNSLISRVVLGSTLSCRPSNRPTGDMNTGNMSGSELDKQHPYPLPSSQNEMKAFTITTYWLYINPGSRGQGRHKTGSSVHVHTQHNDNVDIVLYLQLIWHRQLQILSYQWCATHSPSITATATQHTVVHMQQAHRSATLTVPAFLSAVIGGSCCTCPHLVAGLDESRCGMLSWVVSGSVGWHSGAAVARELGPVMVQGEETQTGWTAGCVTQPCVLHLYLLQERRRKYEN